jgi:mono/diheme cytochrome c family protein
VLIKIKPAAYGLALLRTSDFAIDTFLMKEYRVNVFRTTVNVAAVAVALASLGLKSLSLLAAGSSAPSFTADQATKGQRVFYANCAMCHGVKLQGISGPALKGGDSNLSLQSVSAVYTYTSTEMPAGNAGGLKSDDYVNVIAFLFKQNGQKPGSIRLSASTLKASTAKFGGEAMK